MSKVFVSFDYDNDRHYKRLLEAWHANPRFQFVFDDGTPQEIASTDVGRVKAALTVKVKDSAYTVVVVGKFANQIHRHSSLIGYRNWINFEVARSVENGNRIVAVMLDRSNTLPEELTKTNYTTVQGFTEQGIINGLNNAQPARAPRYGQY